MLLRGSLLVLFLLGAHTANHLLRHPQGPAGVSAELWIAASLLFALVAVALMLAARGDTRAPIAAAVAGFAGAFAPLLGHALPDWGPLSQSYWDRPADPLGWALLAAVALAGLRLGTAGLRAMRAGPAAMNRRCSGHPSRGALE